MIRYIDIDIVYRHWRYIDPSLIFIYVWCTNELPEWTQRYSDAFPITPTDTGRFTTPSYKSSEPERKTEH